MPRTRNWMSNLYWLSEAQMKRLWPYLPKSRGPRVDDRRVLSGIIFLNRNGLRCVTRRVSMVLTRGALQPMEKVE